MNRIMEAFPVQGLGGCDFHNRSKENHHKTSGEGRWTRKSRSMTLLG